MPAVAVAVSTRRAVIDGTGVVSIAGAEAVCRPISPARAIGVSGTRIPAVRVAPAAEPRAGADEDAADEVVRGPVAGGRASVRRIGIVAISTDWLRPNGDAHRAYANAHGDLRGSISGGQKQNSK